MRKFFSIFGIGNHQTFDATAFVEVLFANFFDVAKLNFGIERFIGIDDYDRTFFAQAETTGENEFDFVADPEIFQTKIKFVLDFFGMGTHASRSATDQYLAAFEHGSTYRFTADNKY